MWRPAGACSRKSNKRKEVVNYLQELDSSGEPLEVMLCPASVNSVFLARAWSTWELHKRFLKHQLCGISTPIPFQNTVPFLLSCITWLYTVLHFSFFGPCRCLCNHAFTLLLSRNHVDLQSAVICDADIVFCMRCEPVLVLPN